MHACKEDLNLVSIPACTCAKRSCLEVDKDYTTFVSLLTIVIHIQRIFIEDFENTLNTVFKIVRINRAKILRKSRLMYAVRCMA